MRLTQLNIETMKIYISGKIGRSAKISAATKKKFALREQAFISMGYEVFNPTTSGLGEKAEALAAANGTDFYTEVLLLDLMELKKCDAIFMLKDYRQSHGALAELAFAIAIGKRIYGETAKGARRWIIG